MSYVVIQQPLMNGGYAFRHIELDHYYTLLEQNEGVRKVVDSDGESTAYGKYILETLHVSRQMELELAIAKMEAANAEALTPELAQHNLNTNMLERISDLEGKLSKALDQISALERKTIPLNVIGGSSKPVLCDDGVYRSRPRLELEELPLEDRVTIAPDPDFAWAKRELRSH